MKRCARCGREGTRAFKRRDYYSDAPWVCANTGACAGRCLAQGTPADAVRVPGFTTFVDVHGGGRRPGEDLKLGTVVFVDGGSVLWFEEPDTLVIWHVHKATGRASWPTRYRGTWQPCDCKDAGAA